MSSLLDYCYGENCPMRAKCARFKEDLDPKKDNHLSTSPYNQETGKCGHFVTSTIWIEIENILNNTTGGFTD